MVSPESSHSISPSGGRLSWSSAPSLWWVIWDESFYVWVASMRIWAPLVVSDTWLLYLDYRNSWICIQRSGAYAERKAIARAVRAHFIVDAALNAMMLTDVLNAPVPIQSDKLNSNDNAEVATMPPYMSDEGIGTPDLDEARVVHEKLMGGTVSVEYICRSDVINRIKDRLHKHAESAMMSSRTASLWLSTWAWYISFASTLGQSALETGHYLCKPSTTCFPTWQPRATTCTLNLPECISNRWPIWRRTPRCPSTLRVWVARDSKKRSPVGRYVIGSDHRAGSDDENDDQRLANTRARDHGATAPGVTAANISLSWSKPGNTRTHRG